MTVLVFTILFGLSFVVFPCEGKISLPPEGDTFIVAPGTNVKIAWKFDDKIEDLLFRYWSHTGDKVLATISKDQDVDIEDKSPLPEVEIEKPSTLVLKNVDSRYNGTYKFQIVGTTTTTSYVTVIVAGNCLFRPGLHVSGFNCIRKHFVAVTLSVHTYPAKTHTIRATS